MCRIWKKYFVGIKSILFILILLDENITIIFCITAQSSKLLNSPAHSSASRTNSNNSSGASGSVLSTKTSSDNCAQSHKSSSSEKVQHHTTRAGTSDSSKSPETISEPTEVNTTLDSTLKDEHVYTETGKITIYSLFYL